MPQHAHPGGPLDLSPHVTPARYLSADVPPVGGRIKERPEDFIVEELPLYEPCGEGEHIYLFVQKRNLSTLETVRILAKHFGVDPRAVGYAGLKDKAAVTHQHFSVHVPGKRAGDFPSIRHEGIEVHWVDQHTNKIRTGHLAGNRFSIRIRGVLATKAPLAMRALTVLARLGVPNRFGEQRFGVTLRNHLIGRAMILGDEQEALRALLGVNPAQPTMHDHARRMFEAGDYRSALEAFPTSLRTERRVLAALARGERPSQALRQIDRTEGTFFLSAYQSAVFNAVLDARLQESSFGALREGDLAIKHDNLAVFKVDAATLADPATAERARSFAISPSGPLWGATMMRAEGQTDSQELAALLATGVSPDDLARYDERRPGMLKGSRRPLRVPLMYPDVEGGTDEHGHYVRCSFELPRGAFATAVLREVMKPEEAAPGEAAAIESDEGETDS